MNTQTPAHNSVLIQRDTAPAAAVISATETRPERSILAILAVLVAHAALAVAMKGSATVATLHCLVTVIAALGVAAFARRLFWIPCAAGYFVGAEVLWRMCGAAGPWELSKFAVTAVLLIGLLRMHGCRILPSPVLYGLFLLPGVIVSSMRMIHMALASRLSVHLSGPLALMVCLCFFPNCRLTRREVNYVLLAIAIPISSVCFVAAQGTFSRDVVFGTQSMADASGDFGPNQVASALGFGALAFALYLVRTPMGLWRRLLILAVMIACLGQSALTLSRGGIYAAVGAFIPAVIFLALDRKSRRRALVIACMLPVLGAFVIFPMLDDFSGGAITRRFQEKGMSGREALMASDLELWSDNFWFGVGVGRSQLAHAHAGQHRMTHNEYTRCLSEHGVFGLAAIIMLGIIAFHRILTARTMEERALAAALITWGALFMYVNGMRLAAPTLAFGLATAPLRTDDESPV